jgi:hypothetical protein
MAATALKQRDADVWTAEGQADTAVPGFLRKYDFSTRMTVIRLPDGGLFLHSPVRLDDRSGRFWSGTLTALSLPTEISWKPGARPR